MFTLRVKRRASADTRATKERARDFLRFVLVRFVWGLTICRAYSGWLAERVSVRLSYGLSVKLGADLGYMDLTLVGMCGRILLVVEASGLYPKQRKKND